MKIFNTLSKAGKKSLCRWSRERSRCTSADPTVYNFIHIGNARPMIVFDTVQPVF